MSSKSSTRTPSSEQTFQNKTSKIRWLALLGTILLVLAGAALYISRTPGGLVESKPSETHPILSNPGPWGELEYIPIDIEIPDHFLDSIDGTPPTWFFGGYTKGALANFLKGCGLGREQETALMNQASWEMNQEGCRIRVEDKLVRSLSPHSRSAIYNALARFPENIDQYAPNLYRPERIDDRLEKGRLSPETIRQFKELLYPAGNMVAFADSGLILRSMSNQTERLRFMKTVSRRGSFLIKLNVRPDSDVKALVKYWGGGAHAKDFEPLLESLTRVSGGCKIDIAHLLPPFARKRIYTFPHQVDTADQLNQDCHWTSFNFFREIPQDDFSDPEAAIARFETEYELVGSDTRNARYGDMLVFQGSSGINVHSAIYIADDMIFTKNGAGKDQPWIFMKLEDLRAIYVLPNGSIELSLYRRKAKISYLRSVPEQRSAGIVSSAVSHKRLM
ncbi:MAG: hypothetical protein H0X66_08590 [Verrucomicrobia bacterium]|nr:hypothetical protein [Verrucomicrobiota bacterium]